MKLWQRRTFKVDIVFAFTLLIILTVVSITSFVYFRSRASTITLVKLNFHKEAQHVLHKTDSYLKEAQLAAQMASTLFAQPQLQLALEGEAADYLLHTVTTIPQIAMFYYGDEQGNFLQAGKLGEKIYLKHIRRVAGKAVTKFNYFDNKLRQVRTENSGDTRYDPRTRPWYKGAKKSGKLFWTSPYIFFENGQPGITVSCPVYLPDGRLRGVVAADILLSGLSRFLKEIDISKHSIAFIIDKNGKLLAYPQPEKMLTVSHGKIERLAPYELKIPALTQAVRRYQDNPAALFSYAANSKRYLASFTRFGREFNKEWLFGIVAPEDYFLQPIRETLRLTMLLAIGGLILAVVTAIAMARRISQPIEELANEIMMVKNFDIEIERSHRINSHIHEIQTMDRAIQAMKNSLHAFRLYVPATLVKQLIDSGEEVTIGGKSRELTVFFSDIADFTTIAEDISPKELMLQLSDYFDIMTEVIESQSGTIDKFIGDAVMAFWGAPVAHEEHAVMACRAALQCQKALAAINQKWVAAGRHPFHTRMGLNTEYMIVGNMGPKHRMNYSVMGDGVNLASRLEGLNKLYRTNIIISKGTHRYIHSQFVTRIIDQITVKGKSQSVVIYELMAENNTPEAATLAPLADGFNQGYKLYLQRHWTEAKEIFNSLLQKFPDDYLCQLYITRCENFIKHEPDQSWSGISKIFSK